jgi:uncharacterized protein
MSLEQSNKARVQRFYEALNAQDTDYILGCYADDVVVWTSGRTLISGSFGLDDIRMAAGRIFEAFPDGLQFTLHAMTAEGERVAVEAESRGRHVSGRIYNNLYHFLIEFRDGKIIALKEYMDTELVTDILCGGQRPAVAN